MSNDRPRRRITVEEAMKRDPMKRVIDKMGRIPAGTLVIMKSGGPVMTAVDHYPDAPDVVGCTWFDKNWNDRSADFAISTLEIYQKP